MTPVTLIPVPMTAAAPSVEVEGPASKDAELHAISVMSIATAMDRRTRIDLPRTRPKEYGGVAREVRPSPNRCRVSVMLSPRTGTLAALCLICKSSSVIAGRDCRGPPARRDCQLRKGRILATSRLRADLYAPGCPRPCDGRLRGNVHRGHAPMGHRPPAAGVRPPRGGGRDQGTRPRRRIRERRERALPCHPRARGA